MGEWVETARGWIEAPEVQAVLLLAGSVVLAFAVDLVLCRFLLRLTLRTRTDLDDRLISLLHRPIFVSVVLVGAWLAVQTMEPAPFARRLLVGSIQTVAVLVWLLAGLRICSTLLAGLSGLADRVQWLDARTLPLFDNLAKLLLIGGAAYGLLLAWDLNLAPWLASAGIVGIAVGFAAKDTLANVFGGLFIIVDAPYKIGDYINLDSGERGRVTGIGLRSTRLVTRDDVEITVPNAVIANAKIVNESGGPYEKSRVTLRVGVAYGTDVDRVHAVLLETARSVDEVLEDPAPRVRFTEMGDSALLFRVLCWIEQPELRGLALHRLNTAVYKALDREGIQIPFPQRDVHLHHVTPEPTADAAGG